MDESLINRLVESKHTFTKINVILKESIETEKSID